MWHASLAKDYLCIRFRTLPIIWLSIFSSMRRYSGLLIDNCASLQEITVACWLSSTWNAAWAFTWCSPTFRQFWLSSFPGCPFGWMLIRWPDGQPWAWLLCWRFPAKHQVHTGLYQKGTLGKWCGWPTIDFWMVQQLLSLFYRRAGGSSPGVLR